MTFVLSALAFMVLLTLLVIIHEWGHFTAARWAKVKVEEFGFGLPPRAKTLFRWKGTRFSLNAVPFGGFVRLKGESSLDPKVRKQRGSFASASIRDRLIILCAGVFMNFILALALYTFGFWIAHWVPTYLDLDGLRASQQRQEVTVEWGLYVSEVLEGGGAAAAGVPKGALLLRINGRPMTKVDDVLEMQSRRRSVRYALLVPNENGEDEEVVQWVRVNDGKTGVALSQVARTITGRERGFFSGFRLALRETGVVVVGTLKGIGQLVGSLLSTGRVPEGIAGIVGIAQITHGTIQQGVMAYLRLVALLSLSLAVLNILPFPALDGGRMMFVIFEMISGRPVNRRLEVITNGIGIAFLMALMVAVTWSDIARLLS